MSLLLRRVCAHFVTPPGPASPSGATAPVGGASATPPKPAGVAVLCSGADAPALGAALALAVLRAQGAPCVVVGVWTGPAAVRAGWRAPPLPAARRLATNLAVRGHDACAAGRLAVVRLPGDGEEAAAAALRAMSAAGRAPTVLALGGPRSSAFDALLELQDLVVVALRDGADPSLGRLAVASLGAAGRPACACAVPAAPPARALAAAGLGLLPSARRALAAPVEALR